jgi:peptidoglycan hydrolase-like protein with peptidoglycan-binding domain
MTTSPANRGSRKARSALVATVVAIGLLASACGSDDKSDTTTASTVPADPVAAAQERVTTAESGVKTAQDSLTAAAKQACGDATSYVEILDRYGKLFTDDKATVGDVKTLGDDLVAPRDAVSASAASIAPARDAVAAAQQELVDAQAALADAVAIASSLPTSTTTPQATTTTTIVPAATTDRVQQAEKDLAKAAAGITDATTLADATAEYNSAAFALQIAWMRLLSDGGCLSDEQQANAVAQVAAYTTNLQTQLQQVSLYAGQIDGIYGPETLAAVKQLQKDSGLPETGYADKATQAALDAKLAALGQQAAAAELTSTATVQTILTLTGFWTGPIDGVWTDELTAALQAFQTKLGVPPSGEVDAPTLAAFEQAVAAIKGVVTATTTLVPETVAPTPAPPAATDAPPVAPPTETTAAP